MQAFLDPGVMRAVLHLPVADDHIRRAIQNRLDQHRNTVAGVLVVAICVDDNVRAGAQAGVDSAAEGLGQALVLPVTYHVIGARLPGRPAGVVARAIVDDQDLDRIDAGDAARNVGNGPSDGPRFVMAGNLYDQLHWPACV